MEEDTVVALPRPGSGVMDDPLLAVLREGARRMLTSPGLQFAETPLCR
jgi:hypothetical protein